METENKYKTFGDLKVGDEIIATGGLFNGKHVFTVLRIKKCSDCTNTELVNCLISKENPYFVDSIQVSVDAYGMPYKGEILISDAKNADKIIEEIRIKKKRGREEKRKQLEAIREQAQKNPPRFITLNHKESDVEFVVNVDSIRTVWKKENFSNVCFKEDGLKISVSNDYEEIKAKLGL